MNDDQFTHPLLQERPGGMPQRDCVQTPIEQANLEASGLACLDFVEDAIIDVFEGRIDDFCKAVAVLAHDIDTGFETSLLGGVQEPGRTGAELRVRLIERIKQQQIPQMKD